MACALFLVSRVVHGGLVSRVVDGGLVSRVAVGEPIQPSQFAAEVPNDSADADCSEPILPCGDRLVWLWCSVQEGASS